MGAHFLVIEGPDGAGKTTQAARLADSLRARDRRVVVLREPGATPVGEAIRDLLLAPSTDVVPMAEMLLYQAARAQVVQTEIRPALEAGTTVVLDRYWYSTVAYQGYGLGVAPDAIRAVSGIATGGLVPDHLFLLDLAPETGLARLRGKHDRIEGRPLDYHRRVRDGFLAEAARLGAHATVLDATLPPDEIARRIESTVARL